MKRSTQITAKHTKATTAFSICDMIVWQHKHDAGSSQKHVFTARFHEIYL